MDNPTLLDRISEINDFITRAAIVRNRAYRTPCATPRYRDMMDRVARYELEVDKMCCTLQDDIRTGS